MIGGDGLRARLRRGDLRFGAWCTLDSPVVAQLLGRAGFDFIVVDVQHGYADMAAVPAMVDALQRTASAAIVRVSDNVPHLIGRALDVGADGVIVPLVNSADDARRAVGACRYGPAGSRSWGPMWQDVREWVPDPVTGDERSACILMIETLSGYESVDEIAAVAGVDALYVGPNDLSLSAGLGRVSFEDSPPLRDLIRSVVDRGHAAGVPVGVDCRGAAQAQHWLAQGADFVISSDDIGMLRSAAVDTVSATLRELRADVER